MSMGVRYWQKVKSRYFGGFFRQYFAQNVFFASTRAGLGLSKRWQPVLMSDSFDNSFKQFIQNG